MKNICFLSGDMTRFGGTERITSIISNELLKRCNEFNIHILSINYINDKISFDLDKKIKTSNILSTKNLNFKRDYLKVVKGIRKYIKNNNIDILIDVDVICDIFSIPATRFTKIKLISWEHFNYYINNGIKLRDIARKIAAKFSDCIITLTERDKDAYISNLNIKGKIEYIYNPITLDINEKCDINSKKILSVGRFEHQKGYDMLCKVAKEVLHNNPEWKWIVLGDGEQREMIEALIKEYKLEDKLILKGNVSNVEYYYKESSIFVMTSRFEGLPMVLLEAKCYGIPMVSFDCLTGPSDIITNDVNGYLIDQDNIDEISKSINKLVNDVDLRVKFSDNSKFDINKFSLDSVMEKWISVLGEV